LRHDKAIFASAHPLFFDAYRNMVTKAYTLEDHSRLDIASHDLTPFENLTSLRLGIDIEDGSPSLCDLKVPPKVSDLTLVFPYDPPSRRSLSALPDNFSNLRSLRLTKYGFGSYTGSNWKEGFLNSDGSLKVLSSLRHLEELDVGMLYTDEGIQYLTSLTKLTIAFPNMAVDYPRSLYCHGCDSIHLDDPSDLEIYTKSIPWAKGIVFGRNIGTLPNLKEFFIDFDSDQNNLGYTGVLHRLLLREPSRFYAGKFGKRSLDNLLSENIHSPPNAPLYFQNLETIEFRNCGGPEHFLYTAAMHRRIQYPSEGLSCNDLWHTCVIWESMRNFPKLKNWRLHAFDGGLDREGVDPSSTTVNWPCACGCGTVTGQMVEKRLPCGIWTSSINYRTFVEMDRPEGL